MKKFFLLIFCLTQITVFAQDIANYEKPPVFPECETQDIENLKVCFKQQLLQFLSNNFEMPQMVEEEN